MKIPAQRAAHPRADLQREIVRRLRDYGSVEGAEQAWTALKLNRRLWIKMVTYGLTRPEQQGRLNKIAFPDCNWIEVDAALAAGNKLRTIHALACGTASIAKDLAGHYLLGSCGLKTTKQQSKPHARPGFPP